MPISTSTVLRKWKQYHRIWQLNINSTNFLNINGQSTKKFRIFSSSQIDQNTTISIYSFAELQSPMQVFFFYYLETKNTEKSA